MSSLPSLSGKDKETAVSGVDRTNTRKLQVHLPSIFSGSHGNEVSLTPESVTDTRSVAAEKRPRTLLPAPRCMDFTEAVRLESSPLKTCVGCGLEFGSSSILLHKQSCMKRSRMSGRRHGMAGRKERDRKTETVGRSRALGAEAVAHRNDLAMNLPPIAANCTPFNYPCQFCGEKFGKHSIHLHERRCSKRPVLNTHRAVTGHISSTSHPKDATVRHSVGGGPLMPKRLEVVLDLPPRPQTRTLDRSILAEKGFSIPTVGASRADVIMKCQTCGNDVPGNKMLVHTKTCSLRSVTVAKGAITFPALESRRKGLGQREIIGPSASRSGEHKIIKKPPTVVCYVCGREYGSKSISIHEPQCLKKFEIENRKLPISERKPLPKKPISSAALVVTVTASECEVRPSIAAGMCNSDLLQDAAEEYFLHCYSEFEKELVPCSKCGRKFAPERHAKHANRCRAKPLNKAKAIS